MNLYQFIFLIIELLAIGFFVWLFGKFFKSILQSSLHFKRKFDKAVQDVGWERALRIFSADFFHHIFSFLFLLLVIFLLPVLVIVFKDFFGQVVGGNMNLSRFINHIPEVAASVANFYSNLIIFSKSFVHRLTT